MCEIVISSDTTLTLKELYRTDTEVEILFMVHQLDSTFLATSLFFDYWLAEMDKDGKIISTIDFPIWEETAHLSKNLFLHIYTTSRVASTSDKKKVVVASHNQGVISLLRRTDVGMKEYKQLLFSALGHPIFARVFMSLYQTDRPLSVTCQSHKNKY